MALRNTLTEWGSLAKWLHWLIAIGIAVLIVLGLPAGYYLALFTSAVIGILQAVVHGVGYFREGRKTRGLGVGFYTSIPLAAAGLIVFIQCLRMISN